MVQYQSPVQQHHQITKLLYIKPTTTPSKAFIILHTSIPNCLRLTYGIHIPSHRHSGFSRQDRSGAEKLSNSGATKSFSVMLPRTPYCPRINGRDFRPLPWFPAAGTALDNRCLRVWSGTRKVHWLSMVGRVRQFVHTYPYLKVWDVSVLGKPVFLLIQYSFSPLPARGDMVNVFGMFDCESWRITLLYE